jgi:hypothetical protein
MSKATKSKQEDVYFSPWVFLKTSLISYASCRAQLINGISKALHLLHWLSVKSLLPRPGHNSF